MVPRRQLCGAFAGLQGGVQGLPQPHHVSAVVQLLRDVLPAQQAGQAPQQVREHESCARCRRRPPARSTHPVLRWLLFGMKPNPIPKSHPILS